MNNVNITGTLREGEGGELYTFSVKAFKSWKRAFLNAYLNQFGTAFRSDVPDSEEREALYKAVLRMHNVDIFGSGRISSVVNEQMFNRVLRVAGILKK